MNQQARTDSTEDLLDIIRGDDVAANGSSVENATNVKSNRKASKNNTAKRQGGRLSLGSCCFFGSEVKIGIDITSETIDIVKFCGSAGKGKLLGLERMLLSADQTPGSASFLAALTSLLDKYIDKPKKTKIWALLRTSEIDVSALKLPKMPLRRLSSAVYWQLQKEKKFDEKEFLLDYRVQGTVKVDGIPKQDIVACIAKKADVEQLASYFKKTGFPLAGITVVPAAFQSLYEIGWVPDAGDVVVNIHVDVNFTSISIFSEGKILFSRTIKFGTLSLAEDLLEHYNSSTDSDELAMPDAGGSELKEEMTLMHAHHVIESVLTGQHVDSNIPGSELSSDDLLDGINVSLDRVSRQAERTIDYYTQNFGNRCDVLHLSGEIFASDRVSSYVSKQLGIDGYVFEPLKVAGNQGKCERLGSTESCMQFNEPVALAMCSDSTTLNLLNTYKIRDEIASKTYISNLIAIAAMVLVMIGAAVFLWGTKVLEDKTVQLQILDQKLGIGPHIDETRLQLMAGNVVIREANVRTVCQRYRPLAVLSEVSDMVPEGVRLLSLDIELVNETAVAADQATANAEAVDAENSQHKLVIDGIVLAGERDQETLLTRFLANLESSVMIENVTVEKSEPQAFIPEGPVVHFIIQASLS